MCENRMLICNGDGAEVVHAGWQLRVGAARLMKFPGEGGAEVCADVKRTLWERIPRLGLGLKRGWAGWTGLESSVSEGRRSQSVRGFQYYYSWLAGCPLHPKSGVCQTLVAAKGLCCSLVGLTLNTQPSVHSTLAHPTHSTPST